MSEDNKFERYNKRYLALRQEMQNQLPEWRDIMYSCCPRLLPYLLDEGRRDVKNRRNKKIINTHPVTAARTHQRGMTAGIASPARPWFRLRSPDKELNRFAPVAEWLYNAQQVLEDMFARSNFYNAIGACYGEQGKFGTLALGMFEDEQDDLRCIAYPIGSYMIAANHKGRIDTFYRAYRPSAEQIVQQFVKRDNVGNPVPRKAWDWSRVSEQVKNAYNNKSMVDKQFEVVHAIQPNDDRDASLVDARNMPIASCYFEPGEVIHGKFLRESGFEELPTLVARWEVSGEDPWGHGPGLEALGDSLGLQARERQKAKKLDKHNDPALAGSPDLKNKRVSLLNGDITYVGFTPNGGHPTLRPIHEVDANIGPIREDIEAIEYRISRVWDEDMFLMLNMSETKDVTAEAIARKHEERVVQIGPVLERQNDELFDPAIDRAFAIALRRGLFGEPPEELQGSPLKVEYVSLLAQAQRMVGASSIDRMVGFIGGLAKVQADAGEAPDVFDKLDFDQAVDEYSESLGIMPTIIRSDEQVAELRAQRAQRANAQAAAGAAAPIKDAAQAAKALSETQVGGKNVLEQLAGR